MLIKFPVNTLALTLEFEDVAILTEHKGQVFGCCICRDVHWTSLGLSGKLARSKKQRFI